MVFSSEIVQRSEIAPGAEWELETETLSEGALFTVADGISGLLSHGRPILLKFNIGTKMCPRLESTGFLESPSVEIICDSGPGVDLIKTKDVELNIDFVTPTSVIITALGASNIHFRAGGVVGDFPAFLEIAVSNFENLISPGQAGRCADTVEKEPVSPALLVNVQNQREGQAIFERDRNREPVTFWPTSVVDSKLLCLLVEAPELEQEQNAAITTRYSQTFMPVSANYTTDNVDVKRTNGRITVGGDSKTLLRADAVNVRSHQAGLLSLSNWQIDFELPEAYVVCKGNAASGEPNDNDEAAGEDLKRRWLET